MDIKAFAKREHMLILGEHLVAAEEDRLHGKKGHTIDETASFMRQAVQEVLDGKRSTFNTKDEGTLF